MSLQASIDGKNPALEEWCRGYGVLPSDFLFVGISAGRLGAIKTQVPFTKGPSGRLLQRCLGVLGLSEGDEFSIRPKLVNCYLTNFVKGVCLKDDGLNRLPTQEEFDFWWPSLSKEIYDVRPKKVVALGGVVWENLKRAMNPKVCAEIVVPLKHPRAYNSHGALGGSPAFAEMVKDYREALGL